jgi:hypothetical protein
MRQNGTSPWAMTAEAAAQEAGAVQEAVQEMAAAGDGLAGDEGDLVAGADAGLAIKGLTKSQNANAPSKNPKADGPTKHSTPI